MAQHPFYYDSDDDDDDDDDDPLFGNPLYQGIHPGVLSIDMTIEDDLFCGRSSKYCFRRAPHQWHLRFLFDAEFFLFTKWFIIPKLEDLLSTGQDNYFVWLGVLNRFHKVADRNDQTERWSSWRNRYHHLAWASSPQDTKNFIRHMVGEFSDETFTDVSEMLALESGWVFSCIVEYHIRICNSLPNNELRYAGKPKVEPFHPYLQEVFKRNVIDPAKFLKVGYYRENCCVPMAIILALHAKFGPAVKQKTLENLQKEMETLNYQSVMQIEQNGMTLAQISQLEKLLSPIPSGLVKYFPALRFFHGIGINVYTVQKKDFNFRIFPSAISPMARKTDWFQIDLFIDGPDIRKTYAAVSSREQTKSNVVHALFVKNLRLLLTNFTSKFNNDTQYQYLCRSCFKVFRLPHLRTRHWEICAERKRGVVQKRRSQNVLVHRPWKKNKWTGQIRRNGLFFPRKWVHRKLAPLGYVVFDFESYHEDCNPQQLDASRWEGPFPKSSLTLQTPMAYSHVMRSLYQEHELPHELSLPRVHFLNPHEENPQRSFFTALLISMRDDLLAYHEWQMQILDRNEGPLPLQYRSAQEMAAFLAARQCELCGAYFHQKQWSIKTQSYYRVKKCYDHNHYLRNSKGCRAIICAGR